MNLEVILKIPGTGKPKDGLQKGMHNLEWLPLGAMPI
jgi:hypothetical protein